MPDGCTDESFAEALIQMGGATFEQVLAARTTQAEAVQRGQAVPLAEVLIRQGVITPLMRENVERKLEARQAGGGSLGPYRLLRRLGEGGMGTVYLAEDAQAGRLCALKVLRQEYSANAELLKRFHREAVATGKLNHPNIVAAHTFGDAAGVHYYAMEHCEGQSLDRYLKKGDRPIPWPVTLEIVTQVARGLEHAHAHGIVHRDIKPANIFICNPAGTQAGQRTVLPNDFVVKILDLGLSKTLAMGEEASFLTQTGTTLGTPHYISPEQAQGASTIDGRADIYSLGATWYHMIVGDAPFSGPTPAVVILKHLSEPVPDPRDRNPGIPQQVSNVLVRMLAKEPNDRYADCTALLVDLEHLAGAQTTMVWAERAPTVAMSAVRPPSVVEMPPDDVPIGRWMVFGVLAALAFSLLIGIAVFLLRETDSPMTEKTDIGELQAQLDREKAQAALREAQHARRDAEQRARQAEASARQAEREVKAREAASLRALEPQRQTTEMAPLPEPRPMPDPPKQDGPATKDSGPAATTAGGAPAGKETVTPPVEPPPPARRSSHAHPPEVPFAEIERWAAGLFERSSFSEPPFLARLRQAEDVEGLNRVRQLLARRSFDAEEAMLKAQGNERAVRNRIEIIERRVRALERAVNTPPSPRPTMPSKPLGPPPPERDLIEMERDRQQLDPLRTQLGTASREVQRMAGAQRILASVQRAVTDRLRVLGAQAADATAAPATDTAEGAPRKDVRRKIYVLKDGTELKAYMTMKMGDQIAIRDEAGEMRTVNAADVKEVRNEP